jgi:hypothetical protein
MATKPKTYPYAVMYNDNTHVIYELTNAEFKVLSEAFEAQALSVIIEDIGILMLGDIRAVIKQKVEVEKPQEVTPAADPTLSPEEMAWVMQYRDMVQSGKDGYN